MIWSVSIGRGPGLCCKSLHRTENMQNAISHSIVNLRLNGFDTAFKSLFLLVPPKWAAFCPRDRTMNCGKRTNMTLYFGEYCSLVIFNWYESHGCAAHKRFKVIPSCLMTCRIWIKTYAMHIGQNKHVRKISQLKGHMPCVCMCMTGWRVSGRNWFMSKYFQTMRRGSSSTW